ncbi:MAG: hypothetical protein WBG50_27180, partial [Desulfomonilaceae bacterium]
YVSWMDAETFDQQKANLERGGQQVTDEEFTLHLLNEQVQKLDVQDDLISQKLLYLRIADLQHHRMGLDPYDARAALFRCELLHDAQQLGYDWKVKVHASCKCENCSRVDGKVMTIQEALVKMPLPVRGCEMKPFARYDGYVEDENS